MVQPQLRAALERPYPTSLGPCAVASFLNRDSWFPLLGFYFLALFRSGGDRKRVHFEQDASYHSGELYTDLAVSQPNEIFVGQFARLMGFLSGRNPRDNTAVGLSDENVLFFLTVEVPGALGNPLAVVAGAVDATAAGVNRVRFRENYYIPLEDRVENAIGAFFVASRPFAQSDPRAAVLVDEYVVHVTGELTDDVVRTVSFDADFLELRKLKVKPLVITSVIPAGEPILETEQVLLDIQGDPTAEYGLRYAVAPPASPLVIDGRRITAPVAGPATHTLQITATYGPDHPVFLGAGQKGPARLTAEQRTNLCQELEIAVAALPTPVIGPVTAGTSTPFSMPIAPASVTVTSPLPAGAAVNASVVNGTGRPAELTFIAPNAVTAPTDVTFVMQFGTGAITKPVPVTVPVTP